MSNWPRWLLLDRRYFLLFGYFLQFFGYLTIAEAWKSKSFVDSLMGTKLGEFDKMYSTFNETDRLEMLQLARDTFGFAYDSYMEHAFPADELNPLVCNGRGPDIVDRSNININDVLGNYSLTLIDTLDTLLVMGNYSEFKRAVKLVVDNVTFDNDSIVQVFEATIRVLGGLLSAHLLIVDEKLPFGSEIRPSWYKDELVYLARDLALRLLPALEKSATGLPYPRVHLREGVPNSTICHWCPAETCPAGAGSLLLEFGVLSRLLRDPRYEIVARKAIESLWSRRAETGLLGNSIDVESAKWLGEIAGVGAGIDSFYEYLQKSWIIFGDERYLKMFQESYHHIKRYIRRGRANCNSGFGNHPVYVNVNMHSGRTMTSWIDSLAAAWAGVQLLAGDVEESICTHMLYYNIWRRFGFLPERFNWQLSEPDISFYPLRPELAESTYLLYQATKNPFYLHVGRHMLQSINKYTRSKCGYATVHDVQDKSLEDRMESFFLSETCKYLFLLFDKDNPLNKDPARYVFNTEGHVFPLDQKLRVPLDLTPTADDQSTDHSDHDDFQEEDYVEDYEAETSKNNQNIVHQSTRSNSTLSKDSSIFTFSQTNCDRIDDERRFLLPLKNIYFAQLSHVIGID